MNIELIMKTYLDALNQGETEKIISLFTPTGVVKSPLYGILKALEFYRELSKDTSNSKIEFKNSFIGKNTPHTGAIQFIYHWTMKSGDRVTFDCMDVFKIDPETSKIEKLTIIYDTYPIRNTFTDMKKVKYKK